MENKKTVYPVVRIQDMAVEDRPREKCAQKGIHSLSNTDLLAILIGHGTRKQSAIDLAKQILLHCNNDLYFLGKLGRMELEKIPGIGWAKASRILASIELGKRRMNTPKPKSSKITCSNDAFLSLKTELVELPHEEFWILLLSRSNSIIDKVKISQGGIAGTITDTRLILQEALSRHSSAIILCHNHPSGNLQPSHADQKITQKIKDAAALMDIAVLDHLIIAETGYFSFADQNILSS